MLARNCIKGFNQIICFTRIENVYQKVARKKETVKVVILGPMGRRSTMRTGVFTVTLLVTNKALPFKVSG